MKSRIEQDIESVIQRVKSFAGKVMISCSTLFIWSFRCLCMSRVR